ncbi:MAG: ABC-F type ribosomal protection protein [Lachnospiraceae bacterium]|nr:ABC-F type ribosomal protection protein [Lachnospiraceae bacterium]
MAQILVNNLSFGYEGSFDLIFDDVSFSIDTDWKLGLIGRNGKGKSTFLNLLMGKYKYQGTIQTNTVFDYFPYVITDEQMKQSAAEFIEDLKSGCESWRVICELNLMGVDTEILYRPFETLSHGERTKVLLAVLFSGENDFLLVDEPTNHLDVESRAVIRKYLAQKKGFILVSHDRELLDGCIDHVLVLNRQTIEVQTGNFSSWWENKEKKDAYAQAENKKHLKEIEKLGRAAASMSDWAAKSEKNKIGFDPVNVPDRPKNARSYISSKTKKMQAKVKQMEKRINREIEEKEDLLVDVESVVDLKIMPMVHHKEVLVNVRDFSVAYGMKPVFDKITFQIKKGERVCLKGANGCGKSTMIKAILQTLGENANKSGMLEIAAGIVTSYVNQDTSGLHGTIREYCREQGIDESLLCAILRQLDFDRVQFVKKMEDFSEGQKKKVLLATSLLTPAHLYIWDEPFNYIDVFSRMQIEKLIETYDFTMLFVEHDSRFCEKIATKIVDM